MIANTSLCDLPSFHLSACCCSIYYSLIGSTDEDVLLLEESDESVHINIRHTKDFQYVTVNTFSPTSSKVKDLC